MKKIICVSVVSLLFLSYYGCVSSSASQRNVSCEPVELTTENLKNPIGLDAEHPRFSWKSIARDPGAKGVRQIAYQIQVASSKDLLSKERADLWDSGVVRGDQSIQIPYQGKKLTSSQRCWWKVRVWTNRSRGPSAWSQPASWIMGIVDPKGWKAKWIGANPVSFKRFDLKGAEWIYTGELPLKEMPAGDRFYRKIFDWDGKNGKLPAMLAVGSDDSYTIKINGKEATRAWGQFYDHRFMRIVDVTPVLQKGKNVISAKINNMEKGPTAFILALTVGNRLIVKSDHTWVGMGRPEKGWDTQADSWKSVSAKPVKTCGKMGVQPWGNLHRQTELVSPAFQKSFTVGKNLKEATLHITGLGYYEASLNGTKIGNKVLDPAPTRYDKRILYSTYDLTDLLKEGSNTLNVLLGHGWYDVRSVSVWNFDYAPWRNHPRMLAQLELLYADGTRAFVVSDKTWRQVPSPIGFDCIREGEVVGGGIDGAPDLVKNKIMADEVSAPKGKLCAEALPPSVVTQTLKPVSVKEPKPGVWVVDFGQNLAGWIRLQIKGQKSGDIVECEYGECISKEGLVSLKGIRKGIAAHFRHSGAALVLPNGYFQTDRYVCSGKPTETHEPRFVYYGFQYVQITGLKEKPTENSIQACVVHTDFPTVGKFSCSNDLLNRLRHAVQWSYWSNFANGFPTDCPHREKNGWTGDASLASELAMYNFDNVAAYEKWLHDFMDEQRPDGNLPGIVPTSGWGYGWGNGPAWDSAMEIIPWMLYVYKGDRQILEKCYPVMVKYVDYMTSRSKDGLVSHGLGDWVPVKTITPTVVTSTGYYYLDTRIVARTAEILGKKEDALRYSKLADRIYAAYNKSLYKGNGVYSIGSQTSQSCALHQGLVPVAERVKTEQKLIESVTKTKLFPDFGILGSKYLFRSLSEAGRSDLAFRMLTKEEKPSFGEWLKCGTKTLWEDWEGGSSRNHIMFGDFSAWMYQYLAGIRLDTSVSPIAASVPDKDAVGMKRFLLAPDCIDALTWVNAEHDSPYGKITSSWKRENGTFSWSFDIPVNTTATVVFPSFVTIRLDVLPVGSVAVTSPVKGRMAFRFGSGHYSFTLPVKK